MENKRKRDDIIPDRIDLQVEILPVPFEKLSSLQPGESSQAIRERVIRARAIQTERYASEPHVHCNAQMDSRLLRKYAHPDAEGLRRLEEVMNRYDMSARAYDRILKVARTIADLDGSEQVRSPHIYEAVNYRKLDRSSWGQSF